MARWDTPGAPTWVQEKAKRNQALAEKAVKKRKSKKAKVAEKHDEENVQPTGTEE